MKTRRKGQLLAAVLVALGAAPTATPVAAAAPVAPAVQEDTRPRFEPRLLSRILKANTYAQNRPGFAGIVVRDRQTGAVWRNSHSGTLIWACSTPKLAMVVDLLLRNDSGAISLTQEDRDLMHRMLNSSDNDAATTLWYRYGGEAEFAARFPSYGMTDMRFTDQHPHHWGWILTTTNDLDRLINHVLEELPAKHRDYIVNEMRAVDANQQWGVWGAGAAASPGNKNGWADDNDDGSWLMNTVGFVGPAERYTVAIMDNTQVVENGFAIGMETTTETSRIMFEGYFR
ncbi:serine hydrolase [Kibdelosporangium phytohabitans]|uniref:Tat pathway signal sequence n=1 Tax=Kibdelosporangium phytohabitans TaxID=860235 RepID=A0A0N9I230_9PSEU|nr:tat pathway signal sequence [Kibdelosporangium phytohabitans]